MSDKLGNIPDYDDENCTMCRFYSNASNRCFRFPAAVNKQPLVNKYSWCGEFVIRDPDGGSDESKNRQVR